MATASLKLKTIGEKIREARQLKGLSGLELCRMCDLTSGGLSRIESGEIHPSFGTLVRIAEALDLQIELRRKR